MNRVDLLCGLLAVLAAVGGYRFGFVRRVAAWVGVLAGVGLGVWLLPLLLGRLRPDADLAREAPRRLLTVAIVLGVGALIGQLAGALIGARLKSAVTRRNLGRPDSVMGAVAGILGLVIVLWVALPTMAQVPGWPAREARGSHVARWLDASMGAPPGLLDRLGQTIGIAGLPKVFADLRETPDVRPPSSVAVSDEVLAAGRAATFKVVGAACGDIQSGSAWVARPGLLVTNAHVVAGMRTAHIEDASGSRFAAEVVAFDPRHDLAVLAARGVHVEPLPTGDAKSGDVGVALGYPGGGPFTISNFVVSRRISALGRDIYNRALIERDIYELGADLHPGNSGGPMLDADGRVAGVVFAIAPDRATVGYAITNDQVQALLSSVTPRTVSTGPCTG